jgi:hypothetical protein
MNVYLYIRLEINSLDDFYRCIAMKYNKLATFAERIE